ncbi:type II secretion system F family protein [Candidatus Falkowbacteria bacterium]|nr:type II secretion system F family protein [Candidatus Falkowbacteria bacterium]
MPICKYRAKTADNKAIDGLVEAETETIAIGLLKERNYDIVALEQKRNVFFEKLLLWQTISKRDLLIFVKQLAVMVESDIPLVVGLKGLVEQTDNKRLKQILIEVSENVEGGMKLSDALEEHPRVFDNFFVNLVRTGESSGRLSEVLNYLADQIEKDYDLNKKIVGAFIYPAFIVGAMIILGIVVMVYVIPKLTEMLIQANAELPWATKALIAVSNFFVHNGLFVLLGLVVVAIALYVLRNSTTMRILSGYLKLKFPIFGTLLTYTYVIRFSRSLNTLMSGGVPLAEALDISRGVVGNKIFEGIFVRVQQDVEDGQSFAAALEKHHEIPRLVSQLVETGEEAGKVEEILSKIAEFYSREVANSINKMMSLLEPIIMVLLGLGVGLIIVAIIMPMYKLAGAM